MLSAASWRLVGVGDIIGCVVLAPACCSSCMMTQEAGVYDISSDLLVLHTSSTLGPKKLSPV